ncbi:MAG TPA: aspartate-semialdehyde dehydrogenase [Dehalococcoidia bacterium]|nr:aspartate-semialdehyde dehydrogenase [Dehalococcoidia bacterium]
MNGYDIAIVGATGVVGQEFIKVLNQRRFPIRSVRLLASDRSAGRQMAFNGHTLTVEETKEEAFEGVKIVLIASGADISRHFSPIAVRAGAVVVDNSSAFRMDPAVPLVVPEVNGDDVRWHKGIIANPNCSTAQMVVALWPLHQVNPIRRVIVDTYQSVSGTGGPAVDELDLQIRQIAAGEPVTSEVYPHQIALNVLPEIDTFLDNGYTKEEWKMVEESRKILHLPDLRLSATCVRVPVRVGHSEAVHVEFEQPMTPTEAREVLAAAPGVEVVDDPAQRRYPHPWAAAGHDPVYVGRIRQDASHPNGLAFWIVSDNLRKGAALNAVQIAEGLIARELV